MFPDEPGTSRPGHQSYIKGVYLTTRRDSHAGTRRLQARRMRMRRTASNGGLYACLSLPVRPPVPPSRLLRGMHCLEPCLAHSSWVLGRCPCYRYEISEYTENERLPRLGR